MGISYKNRREIERMWAANQVVCEVLDQIEQMIAPGITTLDIAERAADLAREAGVTPAFLGYGRPPFPSVACVSVNDVIVHGIPSADTVLEEGDIVSVDFGVDRDGYFGDAARTFAVGQVAPGTQRLLDVTAEALEKAIEQCVVGNRLSDVSAAIQAHAELNGFSVVRKFVGHGIGKKMHEAPAVPNYVAAGGRNPKLKRGMVLAIEPMVNVGRAGVKVDEDRWTARTTDGNLSAHFEHSVAIVDGGPWVLSRRESWIAA